MTNSHIKPMSEDHRWRKTTDINHEFAAFELLVNEVVVLDLGFSDGGILEVFFHEGIEGLLVEWSRLEQVIAEGRRLAELDRD